MPKRYFLRCLGTPELQGPNGEPIRFRTRKHLGLLVYLAVEPRGIQRRERVADLLWPNASAAEGRHSVATAISMIRNRMGPEAIEADRDRIRLAHPALELDLHRLLAGDVLGSDLTPPLEVAGFLEGLEILDAPEFLLWRDREHARLLPAIREALLKLMDQCRRTGAFRQIEVLADRMLGFDELSEEAMRAKMEARAFDGDRLTALKLFEAWKGRLAVELGAAPSALLEGMAIRLRRRGLERNTTTDIPTVPTDQWKGYPFVGRTSEYRIIYERWEATAAGTGRHALVLGDSGIGKSTLAERLATAVGLEGAASARVQCYEVEREIPYNAIAGLVRGLLERPGASGTPPEWLAELALTIPDIRQRFSNLPAAPETQGETARVRLAEGVHQLLTAIAEESPILLVVDDVHLADDASVAVLHLIMRRTQTQRIMVLLTARPAELVTSPNAARLRESQAQLGLEVVELPPLSDRESGEVLTNLAGPDLPPPNPAVRRAIVRAAAGFPMVLELLVQDWVANGERCLAMSLGAMTPDLSTPHAPAHAYRELLDRVFQTLDLTARSVLNLAAILGGRLNDLSMYGLVDLSLAQTMTGMSTLTRHRFLRDGGQELEFRNEVIRAQAYGSVPSPLRRTLHSQIADRLLAEDSQGRPVQGLEIAFHCFRSGRGEQGTPYLLRGAEEAMRRGGAHEAERALASALGVLKEPARSAAALLLAEALQEQARWGESVGVLGKSAKRLDDSQSQLARIYTANCHQMMASFDRQERIGTVREMTQLAAAATNTTVRIRAIRVAASLAEDLRSTECAHALLGVIDSIDTTPTETQRLELLYAKANILYQLGERFSSRQCLEEGSELATINGITNTTAANIESGLGVHAAAMGEYANAIVCYSRANQIAVEIGNDRISRTAAANVALCHGRLGQYEQQLKWASLGRGNATSPFSSYSEALAAYSAAFAHAMVGDRAQALCTLRDEERRVARWPTPWMEQAWSLQKADILLIAGNRREALVLGRRATTGSHGSLHTISFAGPYARWVAKVAIAEGDVAEAKDRLSDLVQKVESYDMKDRLEILAASLWLDTQIGQPSAREASLFGEVLGKLPPTVAVHLERLEAMPRLESLPRLP